MMDMRFSNTFLDSLDDIYDHKGIRAPFYKQLVGRVLDYEINRRIRDGPLSLKDLISELKGNDISEKMIRNRIDYLERMKQISKFRGGNPVFYNIKSTITPPK
jgi:hypothetical protein